MEEGRGEMYESNALRIFMDVPFLLLRSQLLQYFTKNVARVGGETFKKYLTCFQRQYE